MTRRISGLIVAAIAIIVACAPADQARPADSDGASRLVEISNAMRLRWDRPESAAKLLAQAGPGAVLETMRLEMWLSCLDRFESTSEQWREVLDEQLSQRLERRARLGYAAALLGETRPTEAAAALETLVEIDDPEALALMLACGAADRIVAARRLGVVDPARLADLDPDLSVAVQRQLTPQEWIERSASWRRHNRPDRAARELGRFRWRGELEQERRVERSRALVEDGQPRGALGVLSRVDRNRVERELVGAQALRRRAWQQAPGGAAVRSFRDCRAAAARVAANPETSDECRRSALLLVLECGTEAGEFSHAGRAWDALMRHEWNGDRLEWYARRLGVLAARGASDSGLANRIRKSVPRHQRCLDYWVAQGSAESQRDIHSLARIEVADIYGLWAREQLNLPDPQRSTFALEIEHETPPVAVQHLLDWGEKEEALREWRRIRRLRGVTPGEALAAAELARALGRNNDAIRWLLSGMPELTGVGISSVPVNVARAYLPLNWSDLLVEAARVEGLDPWLLAGLARQESLFTAHARSPRGARGVTQLIPSTARMHARSLGITDLNLEDPEQNLRIGARELARLIRRFGAVEPALAAYNAGETRARRWYRRWPDRQIFTEEIPIPETYNYVRRVRFLAEAYRLTWDEVWTEEAK